jgi:hypothetical protein
MPVVWCPSASRSARGDVEALAREIIEELRAAGLRFAASTRSRNAIGAAG